MVLTESCSDGADAVRWLRRNSESRGPLEVLFACDIGATNTRMTVAAVPAGGANVRVCAQCKERVKRKETLLRVLEKFGRELVAGGCTVVGASLCGPGPRNAAGTRVGPFGNYEGSSMEEKSIGLADLPVSLFPPGRSRLLNDLEAGAYGIVAMNVAGEMKQRFTKMWGPQPVGLALETGPYLVLAAGTGLGTGIVCLQQGEPVVLPLEFGHTSVVTDGPDGGLIEFLKLKVGRGDKPPEYDDLCTGRGLLWAWEYASQGKGLPVLTDPGQVAQRAIKDRCTVAREAMWLHYKYLMQVGSDLSMGFVLGGILLAGDNVRHNAEFLADGEVCDRLRKFMLSHSTERMGFQSRVTVLRQTSEHNLNLEGNFYMARKAFANPASKL